MNHLFRLNALFVISMLTFYACNAQNKHQEKSSIDTMTNKNAHLEVSSAHKFEVAKSDSEWRQQLTPEEYAILREKGTERPFTSKFEELYDGGTYSCAACGNELFSSEGKFDAGCGWPSFYEALDKTKIVTKTDNSHGMIRTEIMCARCGGHLGHVFDDGPADKTGLRYCVNGASLHFKKK